MSSFAETYQGLKVFAEQPNCLECPPHPREGQRNGTSVSHSQSIETYQLTYFFSVVKAVWIWISWHQSLLLFCLPFSIYLELIVHFVLIKCAFGICGSGCSYIVREECGISYQRFPITIQDLFDFNCTTLGVHSSWKMVMAFSNSFSNSLEIDEENTMT